MTARLLALSVLAIGLLAAASAFSQAYPVKPVRLILPFAPGGSSDYTARVIAQKLTETWRQQVIVDNRAGASGLIGMQIAAKSAPDGYTLTLGSASPFVLNPQIYSKVPYDTLKDFVGLTTVGMTPQIIVVHRSLPVRSLKEFIALAKSQPGALNLASAGLGNNTHLAIELLKSTAGINVQHVPYKGTGPALVDVLGGQIEGTICDLPGALAYVKSGKLRALAFS
jgi:tripartite-type tricarboxylate transporter receptor subunit TctC